MTTGLEPCLNLGRVWVGFGSVAGSGVGSSAGAGTGVGLGPWLGLGPLTGAGDGTSAGAWYGAGAGVEAGSGAFSWNVAGSAARSGSDAGSGSREGLGTGWIWADQGLTLGLGSLNGTGAGASYGAGVGSGVCSWNVASSAARPGSDVGSGSREWLGWVQCEKSGCTTKFTEQNYSERWNKMTNTAQYSSMSEKKAVKYQYLYSSTDDNVVSAPICAHAHGASFISLLAVMFHRNIDIAELVSTNRLKTATFLIVNFSGTK